MNQVKTQTAKVLPKILRGSVHQQFKKCGKSNCKCSKGVLHGAYYYHFVRIGGKLKKRYLKASEVEPIQIACNARRQLEKQQRANDWAFWQRFRALRAEMREFPNLYNS